MSKIKINLSKDLEFIHNLNNGVNISYMSKTTNTTYSHTLSVLKKLVYMDVIFTEKHGRDTYIYLTDKGKKTVYLFRSFMEKLNGEQTK